MISSLRIDKAYYTLTFNEKIQINPSWINEKYLELPHEMIKWTPPNRRGLTPIILNMWLTHLGSEAYK